MTVDRREGRLGIGQVQQGDEAKRSVNFTIEIEREEDGRWIAEVAELAGVMAYGQSRDEAIARVKALALRVLADRLEHGEEVPQLIEIFSVAP